MLTPELLQQIRMLELIARRSATDAMMGQYASTFRGQGIEFEEVREYTPGDDVRWIDRNVSARMGQPYVKVYREERQQTLFLLVDASASLTYGTRGRLYRDAAAELAAILAFLAIRSQDRVGLILFTDKVEVYLPPKKGRGHVWQIIRTVLSFEPHGRGTRVDTALDFLTRVTKRRGQVFLISDYVFAPQDLKVLSLLARRHELVCAAIRSMPPPRSTVIRPGLVLFADCENDTLGATFLRAPYQGREHGPTSQTLREIGARHLDIDAGKSVVPALERFLRRSGRGVA